MKDDGHLGNPLLLTIRGRASWASLAHRKILSVLFMMLESSLFYLVKNPAVDGPGVYESKCLVTEQVPYQAGIWSKTAT